MELRDDRVRRSSTGFVHGSAYDKYDGIEEAIICC